MMGLGIVPFFAAANQKAPDLSSEKELSIEFIDQTLKSLNITINKITFAQPEKLARELGVTSDLISKKIQGLNDLHVAYTRLKSALLDLEKAKKEQQTTTQSDQDYRTKGMITKPPYSLTFHDAILTELSTAVKNQKNIESAIETLKASLTDHQRQLSQKEMAIRQLKEQLAENSENQDTKALSLAMEILEISARHLTILLEAMGVEMKRYDLEIHTAAVRVSISKDQESFVGSNIHYDREDLNHQLTVTQNKETDIRNEINRVEIKLKFVEQDLIKVRQNQDTATLEKDRSFAQAVLKAKDEWKKTYMALLRTKQDSLELLNRQEKIWQHRYAIVKNALSPDQEKKIREVTQKNMIDLNQTLEEQQNHLITLQKQISAVDGLIGGAEVPPSIKKQLQIEMAALQEHVANRLEFQSIIITTDRIEKNLFSQLGKKSDSPSVKDHFSGFGQSLKSIWNLEIWVVDQQSVSVGKVSIALFILVIGIILVRYLLYLVYKRILSTSQFKKTSAAAMHKALSYMGYLLVFLLALRIVNIPLTAFAFIGGAVAIGVGFGAQNLINNFISGFILLGERPIHIGDLVEVDGLLGKVEEIGARCTRIRTGENVDKLVPNSSFLEKTITNWTHSNNRIRTKISVGVAYGSEVKQVEETLIKAATSNSRVLQSPKPLVIFSDFGDNALVFELYFWVLIKMVLEKKQLESQVRFEIYSLFGREGIVIAFPQRDLHFDEKTPVIIQLMNPKNATCDTDEEKN